MKTPEEINIQDELMKIHHKFGTSEMANYKIQQLFDEYGEQQYSQGVKDAAENAEIEIERNGVKYQVKSALHGKSNYCVDKDSILKLIKP